MIDAVSILHSGGTVLWSYNHQQEYQLDNNNINDTTTTVKQPPTIHTINIEPFNKFINDVIISDNSSGTSVSNNNKTTQSYKYNDYAIKWSIDNRYSVIVVAIYLNLTNLLYIDDLLNTIKIDFINIYKQQLTRQLYTNLTYDYNSRYKQILHKYENRSIQSVAYKNDVKKSIVNSASDTTLTNSNNNNVDKVLDNDSKSNENSDNDINISTSTPPINILKTSQSSDPLLDKLLSTTLSTTPQQRKPAPYKKKNQSSVDKSDNNKKDKDSSSSNKQGKTMRTWDGQISKHDVKTLDRSDSTTLTQQQKEQIQVSELKKTFYNDSNEKVNYSDNESDDEDGDIPDIIDNDSKQQSTTSKSNNWFSSQFNTITRNVTGVLTGRTLNDDDLKPVIDSLKSHLMSKNVAADISDKICNQVHDKLLNTKIASFTSIRSVVYSTIEQSLTKVLTPRKPVDVLQGVENARDERRPYTIVMVGVNGVGKSTSLSKMTSYFIHKQYKVGMSACDTFRAGAIEQLRTHAHVLNVPLYSKGYDKDAATVCYDSIQSAKRDNLDVLLIDTAGRMQHNEPLMKSLSKLIHMNNPDLILFVGEALVGNDAVDQINEFNRSLIDFGYNTKATRLIDGIVLTKFDTIDDKVGAAISLTYNTGIPIVFVGTGQTYKDLKKLNVKTILKLLLT